MGIISTTGLARRCGVSQGTVDRALHDRPGISAATRQRILAEAANRQGTTVRVFTTEQLPAHWDGFDTVVCHNDRLAREIVHPRVTGFDAADDQARLAATFAVPYQTIARRAVELIRQKQFKAKPIWNNL